MRILPYISFIDSEWCCRAGFGSRRCWNTTYIDPTQRWNNATWFEEIRRWVRLPRSSWTENPRPSPKSSSLCIHIRIAHYQRIFFLTHSKDGTDDMFGDINLFAVV
jgi:hypothetical protein